MHSYTLTDHLSKVRSDIRGPIYMESLRLQKEGRKILRLNTGNPAAFGFTMPDSVRQALSDGLDKALGYSDLRGMEESRAAILDYHRQKGIQNIDMDDIYLSNGVSEMVQMLTLTCLNRGDEILLPSPNYSLWENCSHIAGAEPVFYQCREENAWCPDIEDIARKITKKTVAILLIHPNNPTGAIYPKKLLLEIVELARKHDLMIFSDEIYDRLIYDDATEYHSVASLCPDLLTVTLNGLSKSHLVCGFRCGWGIISGPEKKKAFLKDGLTRLCAMRLCSNTPAQLLIPAALHDSASTRAMLSPGGRLYEQRKITCDTLSRIDGISFVKNQAAFYLFPKLDKEKFHITDDRKFAMDLLNAKNLLIVPSSGFGWTGNDHFRIVMLPEPKILGKAMEDLGDFLSDYRQDDSKKEYFA